MRRPVVTTPVAPTGVVITGVAITAVATTVDVCCVLAFAIIGRHAHHHGDTVGGIWHTAWPFLAGLAVGLAAARYWRRPLAIGTAGIGAWFGAAGAGMVIRVLAGQGTAAAFIAVAVVFLALFLIGWRFVAMTGNHLWRRSHTSQQRG